MVTNANPAVVSDQSSIRTRYTRPFRVRRDWGISVLLGILGFITFVPLIMLLELSFKDAQQMAQHMWTPAWPLHFRNYIVAIYAVWPYLINSAVFVVGTVAVSITFSTLTAYALARYPFPGREFFYVGVLALLMIPSVLTLITSFVVTVSLKLNNSYLGIWLPMAAGAQAFQIIVLRTYFASLPPELFEAGRIDGASETTMLLRIGLPLSKPILSTLVILQVMGVWNEYIWPLMIFSKPERYPAVLTVMRLGQLITARDPGAMWAGYVIVGLPILILFAFTSRTFIRGLTSGALKF